jgi:sporulation protein YlmC with PRC-barrel domain
MTTHEILGKPVVSMVDGEKAGDARELRIDTPALKVVALVVAGEKEKYLLDWEAVKSFGADAITVEDRSQLMAFSSPVEPIRDWKELSGMNVVDGSGAVLGSVHELVLDERGEISSILTKAGGVFGIGSKDTTVARQEIRGIGPRLITVEHISPN